MLVPTSTLYPGVRNNTEAFPIKEFDGSTYSDLTWPAGGVFVNLMVPCGCT
jgi:hypothetical protein